LLLDGLLDPLGGCPWDLSQDHRSISEDVLEEAYELRESLLSGDPAGILEEAGDLLFLLAFLARLLEKDGLGIDAKAIIDQAVDKMVRRHPHVFGGDPMPGDAEGVLDKWHAIKRREKKGCALFATVPLALPALARNHRLGAKAAKAGFDWKGPQEVRRKLDEELRELDLELSKGDFQNNQERLTEELGDAMAALSNLSRHLGIPSEKALDAHNRRFADRIGFMEEELKKDGRSLEDAGMDELEGLWQKAKGR
jgi:MazG family protein